MIGLYIRMHQAEPGGQAMFADPPLHQARVVFAAIAFGQAVVHVVAVPQGVEVGQQVTGRCGQGASSWR
ncbi:hypothetical protein D3C76_1040710 [compost metagenome]